ncbi:MAG TPA: RdgB/HAM1 family non-canonical purine NTP pyrophosphatase [Polyangiaceae bacterium]|nr:RdgB/HAM1 family non-canonical purine NTP pyrophosphatase [Polyangiaceae bacterium]
MIFATSNPHKLEEARAILGPLGIQVQSLDELGVELEEPEEDGATFEDNARLKARYYARHLGTTCLAEDSGLEVDALGGAPGVYSARYAGLAGSRDVRDRANNERLLRELAAVPAPERTARFVCTLAVADPDGTIRAEARGIYEGVIAEAARGTNGFGYDPLLYLPDRGCTSAELTPSEKHARSHRGHALRQLARLLAAGLPGAGSGGL